MDVTKLIASTGFITVNKALAKKFGLYEAIILGCLCSKYEYHKEHESLTHDMYFYNTIKNFEDETTLSESQQRKAIKHLEELNVISTKRAKNEKGDVVKYFRINENVLKASLE